MHVHQIENVRQYLRFLLANPHELDALFQELQVHQIELEMQNEELRRTQVELEAARDRYAQLYHFAPASNLTLDRHGKIVEDNLRAGTLLGINRKALIGRPLAPFIKSDDEGTFHRHCQDILKTGTRQTCEVYLRKNASAACCLYLESLAVHEESGRITYWRTALLDISHRKRVEKELGTQQAQLEGIIGSPMDAIITVDEKECVVFFNRAAESMFLGQAADAIGQPLDRFIPERFRRGHHGHMRLFSLAKATSRSRQRIGILPGLRANGEKFPFEASISHVLVDDRTLLTVILRDVTDREMAQKTLEASEAFSRSVLNSLSAHVCVLDREGVILKTNDAWKEFCCGISDRVVPVIDVGQNYLEVCWRAIAYGDPAAEAILGGIEAVLGAVNRV